MNLADGLKQLSRMCARYHEICDECPLNNKDFCSLEPADRDDEINERAAAIIEKWAEENPEPVYPTWGEYLEKVIPHGSSETALTFAIFAMNQPIRADIAQKLGIEPKER